MKRKTSTTDSSSMDMPMCKKIKEDIDTSDDDDDDDETSESGTTPTRSSNPLVSETLEFLLRSLTLICPFCVFLLHS